jgi:membrane dipeptidase
MTLIFDGHNDTLQRFFPFGRPDSGSCLERNTQGHLDFPRARDSGFAGGLFAIMVPPDYGTLTPEDFKTSDGYEVPSAPAIDRNQAVDYAIRLMAGAFRMEELSHGGIKIVRSVPDILHCLDSLSLAFGLHFEGAEPIGPGLDELYLFHRAGLRSIGPVWSRPNIFGHGVPLKFPSLPDTGPGLTDIGKNLIRTCNHLGIMIDLSHINEQGFRDVAAISTAPLVATHSNVHSICPCSRNLTDYQLDAIADSGGVIGVTYAVSFLRKDGNLNPDTPLHDIVNHILYIVDRTGIEHVALGSDFDGAVIPDTMKDVTGLSGLIDVLKTSGFDEASLEKICFGNWLRIFQSTWKD